MNKDQSTKEELKAQIADLTAYIKQWTSTEEEAPTKSLAPALLSKEGLSNGKIKKLGQVHCKLVQEGGRQVQQGHPLRRQSA